MSALATVMTKGLVCAPAPTCTSPSYWAPRMTSRLTQWLAGPLDNPKVSVYEDVGPQPRQLNDRAHSPPAVRDDHARPLPQPTPEAPKRPRPGPLAAHDPQVEVRLATARCVHCSLDSHDHLVFPCRGSKYCVDFCVLCSVICSLWVLGAAGGQGPGTRGLGTGQGARQGPHAKTKMCFSKDTFGLLGVHKQVA